MTIYQHIPSTRPQLDLHLSPLMGHYEKPLTYERITELQELAAYASELEFERVCKEFYSIWFNRDRPIRPYQKDLFHRVVRHERDFTVIKARQLGITTAMIHAMAALASIRPYSRIYIGGHNARAEWILEYGVKNVFWQTGSLANSIVDACNKNSIVLRNGSSIQIGGDTIGQTFDVVWLDEPSDEQLSKVPTIVFGRRLYVTATATTYRSYLDCFVNGPKMNNHSDLIILPWTVGSEEYQKRVSQFAIEMPCRQFFREYQCMFNQDKPSADINTNPLLN